MIHRFALVGLLGIVVAVVGSVVAAVVDDTVAVVGRMFEVWALVCVDVRRHKLAASCIGQERFAPPDIM